MKIYIASKLENFATVQELGRILRERGHTITYDWTTHGPVYSHGLPRIQEVAMAEAKGVEDCHAFIMLWPGGRGTHVELGMALGMEKHIILYSAIESHHQASAETCAFYHHPRVRLVKETSDIFRCLGEIYNEITDGHSMDSYRACSACGDLDGCWLPDKMR